MNLIIKSLSQMIIMMVIWAAGASRREIGLISGITQNPISANLRIVAKAKYMMELLLKIRISIIE